MRDSDPGSGLVDDSTFDSLRDGATLITATPRLSREIVEAWNRRQLQNGLTVWDTPDVLPYPSWVERTWKRLRAHSGNRQIQPEVVLSSSQSRRLWKKIIHRDIQSNSEDTAPLWNINATVRSAMEAWRICQQWSIDCADFGDSCLPDHHSFSGWAEAYRSYCHQRQWLDPHQLPGHIVTCIKQDRQPCLPSLVWVGFDHLTPAQENLIQSLRTAGIQVNLLKPDAYVAPQKQYREFDSGRDQWRAAAQWAKCILERNPNRRIAIVTPDLAPSRRDIELEFTRALCPASITRPEKYYDRPFHIALGRQLASYPVIRSAINLLSLFTEKSVRFEAIACMLTDPWTRGAAREMPRRHQLAYRYRRKFAHEIKVCDAWRRISKDASKGDPPKPAPELARIFRQLEPLLQYAGQKKPCSGWVGTFTQWLDGFGWPGDEPLGSVEYQVVRAFRKEILNLATLDLVESRVTLAEALSILNERLSAQPFEPESAKVGIEIMGILESAGIRFDAVWFGDLNEKEWPPRLNKNPFIPATLQVQAGYFKADFGLNHAHAGDLQRQLTRQCREIVFSRPRFEEEVEQSPSPLVSWPDPSSDAAALEPSLFERYRQYRPALEVFEDPIGLPVADPKIRGGMAVIKDYSDCPFRSYAIHRLGAKEYEYPQPGLDAMGRGALIHEILERIWRQIETLANLRALAQGEFERLIERVIDNCNQSAVRKSGLGAGFHEAQARWLKDLIRQWCEVELARNHDFRAIAIEKEYLLKLGGLELSFKVDRIDRLADGSFILIDYKTGMTHGLSNWVGERPRQPQLPLYALALLADYGHETPVEAMVYGRVRHADCGYHGIAIEHEFVEAGNRQGKSQGKPQVTPLPQALKGLRNKIPPSSRSELLDYWKVQLERIARSFAAGRAEVDPRESTVCRNCNLTGLCRRHESGENPDLEMDSTA